MYWLKYSFIVSNPNLYAINIHTGLALLLCISIVQYPISRYSNNISSTHISVNIHWSSIRLTFLDSEK